jgi:sugar phosphate isomerase/epimerase
MRVAVQLYTLRDHLKTSGQIAASLARVRKIGYQAVELAGLGSIAPAELVRILDGEGLTVCGSHVPMEAIQSDPQRVIAEAKRWKCPNVAVPGCWGKSLAEFALFAATLNTAAEKFAAAGLRLGYHNHSHELVKHNGHRPLDLLMETLSPRAWFEIDTYWITHGGGDPIDWIKRAAGRLPCVHLKDMGIDESGKQFMAEIGEGNLNFPGIIAAGREAGADWLVVEQDICQRDPFESVAMSLRNLSSIMNDE